MRFSLPETHKNSRKIVAANCKARFLLRSHLFQREFRGISSAHLKSGHIYNHELCLEPAFAKKLVEQQLMQIQKKSTGLGVFPSLNGVFPRWWQLKYF